MSNDTLFAELHTITVRQEELSDRKREILNALEDAGVRLSTLSSAYTDLFGKGFE